MKAYIHARPGDAERTALEDLKQVTGQTESALGRRGVYSVAMSAEEHWMNIEAILRKYSDRPLSLADACLIRCAEIHQEARLLTFDNDFRVYRWARTRKFELL